MIVGLMRDWEFPPLVFLFFSFRFEVSSYKMYLSYIYTLDSHSGLPAGFVNLIFFSEF